MKKIFALFVLFSAIAIASQLANAKCWVHIPCTPANPCGHIKRNGDLVTYDCGSGCALGPWNGGFSCVQFPLNGCLASAVHDPGCCSTPCRPPAIGCEPN